MVSVVFTCIVYGHFANNPKIIRTVMQMLAETLLHQWGRVASDFQLEYLREFLNRAWDSSQLLGSIPVPVVINIILYAP